MTSARHGDHTIAGNFQGIYLKHRDNGKMPLLPLAGRFGSPALDLLLAIDVFWSFVQNSELVRR